MNCIVKICDIDIRNLLQSPGEDLIIDKISAEMTDLEVFQLELQDKDASLADTCDNFDAVIARYPNMKGRL